MPRQRSVLPRVFHGALFVGLIGWMADAANKTSFEVTYVADTKLRLCYICAYTSHSSPNLDLNTGITECSEFTNGNNIRQVDCGYDCFKRTYARDGVTYVERGCSRDSCTDGPVLVKPLTMHQSCCNTDLCNGANQFAPVPFARGATIACALVAYAFAVMIMC